MFKRILKFLGIQFKPATPPEPPLYKEDGSCNVDWITWYCDKFNAPFMYGQCAWEYEITPPPGPAYYLEQAEWLAYVKQMLDCDEAELQEVERLTRERHKLAREQEAPTMVVVSKDGPYITDEWIAWWADIIGSTKDRAFFDGLITLLRKGIFTQGINKKF